MRILKHKNWFKIREWHSDSWPDPVKTVDLVTQFQVCGTVLYWAPAQQVNFLFSAASVEDDSITLSSDESESNFSFSETTL